MTFELLCATLIALLFGVAVCLNGYRWFIILLPIFGFFFGFLLGAETLQAIFGIGFLATITSWIVGFIVGLVFAVLSYLFYIAGVAILAGAFGYSLGVGLMHLIGLDFGFLVWLVGIVVGIAVAAVTLLFNIQKWVIILITAFGGALTVVGSLLFAFGGIGVDSLVKNPVMMAVKSSPFWMIIFLALGILGVVAQYYNNRDYVLEVPEDRF